MKARDVMTAPVVTVTPEASVPEIAALLIERRISAVPVVDGDAVVGIVSEGDLLRRGETRTERQRPGWLEMLLNRDLQAAEFVKEHGACARDVMSPDVVSVTPDTDLAEIARVLERRRIKRVPVIENGALVGIVSRANLLRALVAYRHSRTGLEGRSDPEIARALDERLRQQGWVDVSRINVVVTDAVVHLWGTVDSAEQRRALAVAAAEIPGVERVEDHLTPDWFANDAG
jgi:CBS-domain-containing membrane protein